MAAPIGSPTPFSRWNGLTASRRRPSWDASKTRIHDLNLRPEFGPRGPGVARGHPQIRDVAEQLDLTFDGRAEASCHLLRCDVLRSDAMDDLVDLETREGPIDGGARGLDRVALAAKALGDTPADFKARPAFGEPWSDPPDIAACLLFLDHKQAEPVQRPMPGHDGCVPPADERVGDGVSIGRNESRRGGVAEHLRVRRHVGVPPPSQ